MLGGAAVNLDRRCRRALPGLQCAYRVDLSDIHDAAQALESLAASLSDLPVTTYHHLLSSKHDVSGSFQATRK